MLSGTNRASTCGVDAQGPQVDFAQVPQMLLRGDRPEVIAEQVLASADVAP